MRRCLLPRLFLLIIFMGIPVSAEEETGKKLPVEWFGQTNATPWGNLPLGTSQSITIHTHGCALTCTAMVLRYFGVTTDPPRLNKWLVDNGGFEDGWNDQTGEYLGKVRMLWNVPTEKLPQIDRFIRYDYNSGPADTGTIRDLIDQGVPSIAEVLRPGGIPHFVVITGYIGEDFTIRDPLDQDVTRLSERYNIQDRYGSGPERNIFSLRVFIPSGKP